MRAGYGRAVDRPRAALFLVRRQRLLVEHEQQSDARTAGAARGRSAARNGRTAGRRGGNAGKAGGNEDVAAFYQKRGIAPVWLDGDKPADIAGRAIEALAAADDHALRPDDYEYQALSQERQRLADGDKNPNKTARRQELARFELRLTTALLTLGRDAAIGRTDPRRIDPRWKRQRELPDLPAALEKTIAENALPQWADRVGPVHPEYARLRKAWAALRPHRDAEWPRVPNVTLRPASPTPPSSTLRYRLIASGELPPEAALRSDRAPGHRPRVRARGQDQASRPRGTAPRSAPGALRRHARQRRARVPGASRHQGDRHRRCPHRRRAQRPDVTAHRAGRAQPRTLALDARRPRRPPHPRQHPALLRRGLRERPPRPLHPRHRRQGRRRDAGLQRIDDARGLQPLLEHPAEIVADETLPAAERDPEYLSRNNIEVVRVSGRRDRGRSIPPTSTGPTRRR